MFTRARSVLVQTRLAHVRRYADDSLDLHALANRIESKHNRSSRIVTTLRDAPPTPTPSTSSVPARTPPPGYEHSLIARQGKKPAPRLPDGFEPFVTSKTYSPHDLLPSNRLPPTYRTHRPYEGPSKPLALREDLFHQLDLNPLDEPFNCALLSSYTTKMGRIQRRGETKLTWKNQRRVGKAIRRARAMGLIPAFSQWRDDMIKSK